MKSHKLFVYGIMAGLIATVAGCGAGEDQAFVAPDMPITESMTDTAPTPIATAPSEIDPVPTPAAVPATNEAPEPAAFTLDNIEGSWRAQSWVILQSDGSFRNVMEGTSKIILHVKTEGFSGLNTVYSDGATNYADMDLTYQDESGFFSNERPSTVRVSNGVLIWEFTDENEDHHFTTWSREYWAKKTVAPNYQYQLIN